MLIIQRYYPVALDIDSTGFVYVAYHTQASASNGGGYIRKYGQIYCGNSVTDTGEDCDDGNTIDTDACKNDCVI